MATGSRVLRRRARRLDVPALGLDSELTNRVLARYAAEIGERDAPPGWFIVRWLLAMGRLLGRGRFGPERWPEDLRA